MDLSQDFQMGLLGYHLQQSTQHLTVEVIEALSVLEYSCEDPVLKKQFHSDIMFNFTIWAGAEFEIQLNYLKNFFLKKISAEPQVCIPSLNFCFPSNVLLISFLVLSKRIWNFENTRHP